LSNLELKACYSHDRPHFSLCPSEKCFPSAWDILHGLMAPLSSQAIIHGLSSQ
jgi:hypothetical protein